MAEKIYPFARALLNEIATAKKAAVDALVSIEAAVEEFIEEHYPDECAGQCEGCGRLLLYGDKGFRYDDGPITCAECSPTWAENKEAIEDPANDTEPESKAAFEKGLAAHLAAGGSLDDHRTWEL